MELSNSCREVCCYSRVNSWEYLNSSVDRSRSCKYLEVTSSLVFGRESP